MMTVKMGTMTPPRASQLSTTSSTPASSFVNRNDDFDMNFYQIVCSVLSIDHAHHRVELSTDPVHLNNNASEFSKVLDFCRWCCRHLRRAMLCLAV
jgi:hypothetical protein